MFHQAIHVSIADMSMAVSADVSITGISQEAAAPSISFSPTHHLLAFSCLIYGHSLQIFVYCNEQQRTCVVAARLDNLGKGASGAAVQNLNIAMGIDEKIGL